MTNARLLKIGLLGPVEISFNREMLKIPRRVERGILYYLAVENQPIGRTRLIDLLWPEAEQVDPRGALRTALSRLRSRLPDKSMLVTEMDQVWLDKTSCHVDLLIFENSYLSFQNILSAFPRDTTMPVQIVNQIEEALGLWRGDQVIEGDDLSAYQELENWRLSLNRRVSLHRFKLMKRLSDHFQAGGQLEQAMELLIHLGRVNPSDISSHLVVINILVKLGRHQEALEFCDELEVIFEREYHAPLPDELLKDCQKVQQLMENYPKMRGQDWPIPLSMQLPLVGRTAELTQLRDCFFCGGLVKIQGEMGIGKTRLVQELFETLAPKPLLIVAPANEIEQSLPFAPIIHALRHHIPKEIWREIDVVWASHLSLFLPELTELRGDCSPSLAGKFLSTTQHLFDALLHLLVNVSNRYGRILFYVDDAQWMDHQSVDALAYLVRQGFFREHGLLILAIGSEVINDHIGEVFNPFVNTHQLQVINLTGLNPNELIVLTSLVLSEAPSTDFIDQLFFETNGNPFIALEIIRSFLEKSGGMDDRQGFRWLPLPETVHALIKSRLNRVSRDARHILLYAALLGKDFPLDLLLEVSQISQQDFLIELETLVQFGLLRPYHVDQANEEKLSFTHEKMREVVIKEAPSAQKQVLHQHIAQLLSQKPQSFDKAAVIADHYIAGGDILNAFSWLLKAAAHASSLGGKDIVLWSYQKAESILTHAPAGTFSTNDILLLYQQWSEYAYQSNQIDDLEEVGVKLQKFAGGEPKPNLMAVSYLSLAKACFLREDFETGLFLIQKAVKKFDQDENHEVLLNALFHQSLIQWWILDFDAVFRTLDQVVGIINRADSDSGQMISFVFNTHRMISETYYAQGRADLAYPTAYLTYQNYFSKLDTYDRFRAENMMAYVSFVAGRVDDCIRFAQRGLKLAQVIDSARVEVFSLLLLSKAAIVQGCFDEAYQYATRALMLSEQHNKTQSIVAANTLLGDIYIILRNFTQAMYYYRIAQVRQGFSFQSYYGLENNIHMARLLVWTDQIVEARDLLQPVLEVAELKGVLQIHIQALLVDALCDLFESDFSKAAQKFSSIIDQAGQAGLAHEVLWAKFFMARLEIATHQYDRAEQILQDVFERANAESMVLLTLFTYEAYCVIKNTTESHNGSDAIDEKFLSIIDVMETNTQSEPLRQDFENAKGYWMGQGSFP